MLIDCFGTLMIRTSSFSPFAPKPIFSLKGTIRRCIFNSCSNQIKECMQPGVNLCYLPSDFGQPRFQALHFGRQIVQLRRSTFWAGQLGTGPEAKHQPPRGGPHTADPWLRLELGIWGGCLLGGGLGKFTLGPCKFGRGCGAES